MLSLHFLLLLLHHLLFFLFHLLSHNLFLISTRLFFSHSLFVFFLLCSSLFFRLFSIFISSFSFSLFLHSGLFSLSSSLCLSLCVLISSWITFLFFFVLLLLAFFASILTQDLSNKGSSVNTRNCCSIHLLKPYIGLISLLSSQYHAWFDVNFLLNDHFSEHDQLNQKLSLAIFVFETFWIELISCEQTLSKIGLLTSSGVNIMKISKWRFTK